MIVMKRWDNALKLLRRVAFVGWENHFEQIFWHPTYKQIKQVSHSLKQFETQFRTCLNTIQKTTLKQSQTSFKSSFKLVLNYL